MRKQAGCETMSPWVRPLNNVASMTSQHKVFSTLSGAIDFSLWAERINLRPKTYSILGLVRRIEKRCTMLARPEGGERGPSSTIGKASSRAWEGTEDFFRASGRQGPVSSGKWLQRVELQRGSSAKVAVAWEKFQKQVVMSSARGCVYREKVMTRNPFTEYNGVLACGLGRPDLEEIGVSKA